MGRLLNPGLGEVIDRQTILVLKCTRAAPDADVTHFQEELARLQMLHTDRAHITEPIRQLIASLRDVNARLWELEDEMARYANMGNLAEFPASQQDCATVAVSIWRFNRERNALVYEINTLAGCNPGPEKL